MHNFIICDQLPNTELIFGIDIQKKFSLSYTWDKDKNCYIQWNGKFLVLTLKIPPRHNGVVPIKISGPLITTHTAYFITDDSTPKGRDPNIPTLTSLMAFIRSRTGHQSTFLSLITPINTSPSTRENTFDALNQQS